MFEKEQKEFFGFYDPHLDMNTYKGKILTTYMGIDGLDMPRPLRRMTKRNMRKHYNKNQETLKDLELQEFPKEPTKH